jgi:hypothetical protein
MISCSMFPQTREGVMSFDALTKEERRGLRVHWVELERDVAVRRVSGWRTSMDDWEVMVILLDCEDQ